MNGLHGRSAEPRRPGRRPGDPEATRRSILSAARDAFAEHGYERATIRMIAAAADVDPALVIHHFSDKQRLFVAAHELPADPAVVFDHIASVPPGERGEELARTMLGLFSASGSPVFSLLRAAATNPAAAAMLREFVTDVWTTHGPQVVRGPDCQFRLALVSSQLIGVVVNRSLIGLPALAERDLNEIVGAVAPTIQRYLDGT